MAQGYYLMTGRPAAVMVHVNVGTANAMCGLINSWRGNIPVLFTSGRTPYAEEGGLPASAAARSTGRRRCAISAR
jgi:acetolactate synthase-1/2/3 large subunit